MSKFTQKIASVGLAVATVVTLSGVAPVFAQTDLQAQINALLLQISTLQAQLGGGTVATAGSCVFAKDLTLSSTGADVKCLQQYLNANGYTVATTGAGSPGSESMYFGGLTKAAVAKWQAAKGVTPSVGYFGSKSRTAYSAMAVLPPVAGIPPVAGTLPAGCTSTVGFSPTTGLSCTGTSTPVVVATEGSFTASLAASPSANPSAYAGENVPVIGVEIKAQGSEMTIDRADWQISVTNVGAGTTYSPQSFIKKIRVWDGTTELGSVALDSTTVNFDSSSRYWVRVSGFSFKVPKDGKKVLTFSVDTIQTIDNNRVVTFQDYAGASNSIRGVDTKGIVSNVDLAAADSRQHTFQSGGASILSLSTDVNNPVARNVYISGSDPTKYVELLRFTGKSTSGASRLITLAVSSTYTSVQPSTLRLFAGSTELAAVSTSNNTLFTNMDFLIPSDTTQSFTVKGDFPTTGNGMVASVSIPAAAGQSVYRKADLTTAAPTANSAISGTDVHALRKAALITFVSTGTTNTKTAAVFGTAAVVTSSTMDGVIKFKVKALGGTLTLPSTASLGLAVATSGTATQAAGNFNLTMDDGKTTNIAEDEERAVTVSANLKSLDRTSDYYWFFIEHFNSTFGGDTFRQDYGISEFKTPSVLLP